MTFVPSREQRECSERLMAAWAAHKADLDKKDVELAAAHLRIAILEAAIKKAITVHSDETYRIDEDGHHLLKETL